MKTFESILKKARKKYRDAVRGKEYQEELIQQMDTLNPCDITEEEWLWLEMLEKRKSVYVQDIALLEDIFGTWLLQTDKIAQDE